MAATAHEPDDTTRSPLDQEIDKFIDLYLRDKPTGSIDPHEIARRIWQRHGRSYTQLMHEHEVRANVLSHVRDVIRRRNRRIRRLPPLHWGLHAAGGDQETHGDHRGSDAFPPSRSRIGAALGWLEQIANVPVSGETRAKPTLWAEVTVSEWHMLADAYRAQASELSAHAGLYTEFALTLEKNGAETIPDLPPDERQRLYELSVNDD